MSSEKTTVRAYKDSSKKQGLYRAADGTYFVTYPVIVFPAQTTRDKIEAAVLDHMDTLRGYFFRCTMDKAEDQHIPTASYNYRDCHAEKGLSVASHPGSFALTTYKYVYMVSGDIVGFGSDGEPLLANVKALSRPAAKIAREWLDRYAADEARKPFDVDSFGCQVECDGPAPDGDLVIEI